MKLLIAPHNDDEILFAAYTIMKFKPWVIIATDSERQSSRGVTAQERIKESMDASDIIGYDVDFLNIKDSELTIFGLCESMKELNPDIVFCPALQHGNDDHNIVSTACDILWKDKCIHYATYTKEDLTPKGNLYIYPTEEEKELKNKALNCFKSQLIINKPHFDAVIDKPEAWII